MQYIQNSAIHYAKFIYNFLLFMNNLSLQCVRRYLNENCFQINSPCIIGGNVVFVGDLNIAEHIAAHSRGTGCGQLEIYAPIGWVKSPMTRVRLILVRMAHKVARRVEPLARVTFDARRVRVHVHVRMQVTVRAAEALMHNSNCWFITCTITRTTWIL